MTLWSHDMTQLKNVLTVRTLLTAILASLLMVGLVASGALALQGPFHEDPDVPCFGPWDPFCSSEDDGTGGSGSVDCEKERCRDCTVNIECIYVDYASHCSCTASATICSAEDVCNVKK